MLTKITKIMLDKSLKSEKGYATILVLVFLMVGSLIIGPLLGYMGTAAKTGLVFENKTKELYAADAGIEDAVYQIKYDHLGTLFPSYSPYDYTTQNWTYPLSEQVNAKTTNVTISNVWIPKDVAVPSINQASTIVQAGKLVVTGSVSAASTYQIKITYYPGIGENLRIQTLGIWLPAGFTYVTGSSNLNLYTVPVLSSYDGGQAVIWTFNSYPFAGDASHNPFPDVNQAGNPMTSNITFQFTSPQPGQSPDAVSWITTSGVSDIPFSWDADTKIYHIISVAGNTQTEAYVPKNELRQLGSAINGDYRATGGSLMIDTDYDVYGVRDILLSSSDATVSDIPTDAEVEAAYLYWSAWRSESAKTTLFSDSCSNFNNWQNGDTWSYTDYPGRFAGNAHGDTDLQLTLKSPVNLSSYNGNKVTLSWNQYIGGSMGASDGLDFMLFANGSWSNAIPVFRGPGTPPSFFSYIIPAQFLTSDFKVRYYLVGCGGSQKYVYLDNIAITAYNPDTSVVFKIDGQGVYFDGNGQPQQGTQDIISSKTQVLPNYDNYGNPNGFSYSCYKDVTALVQAYTQSPTSPPTNHPGNATYNVGGVNGDTGNQWSYAGWSLVIIYSSSETKGHQLYLYDNFMYAHNNTNIDFDKDGQPGGTVSGFIVPQPVGGEVNAAKLTAFVGEGDLVWVGDQLKFNGTAFSNAASPSNNVWNSKSPGLNADGVDVDTFDITWASNLLHPGDTSAQIDVPTVDDSWNLVYIIVSFRCDTKTGGAHGYVIRN